jgi:large subunit ribosomal protein L11
VICGSCPVSKRRAMRYEIMAKEVMVKIKLQASGGQATPAPPIGPALGQHGLNIGQFVSQFNERTKELNGTIVPVVITVYRDKSFIFEVKSPPAAVLLKQAAEIAKGSGVPNKEKVGEITAEQLRRITETKFKDLNAYDLDQAEKIIRGTARSMGIEIVTRGSNETQDTREELSIEDGRERTESGREGAEN